jgi:hypothetical protein
MIFVLYLGNDLFPSYQLPMVYIPESLIDEIEELKEL